MIILLLSIGLALIAGLIKPFAGRLQATGLWAAKALVPEEMKEAHPRGLQDALTDGWPSNVGFLGGMLPFLAAVLGFFHAWWAGILALVVAVLASAIAERIPVASPYVERYLTLLAEHLNNRRANFKKIGDTEREAAAAELLEQLAELRALYTGSCVLAPDVSTAKAAPFGDRYFLLEHAEQREAS